jgi:TRAP-type mannitol/chloroaromatic compound transport system permease small subunit
LNGKQTKSLGFNIVSTSALTIRFIQGLETINRVLGLAVSWLTVVMVIITFTVVVLRYLFDSGSIALQESVTYLHAIIFMSVAAHALQQDSHVRVDIFYQRFSTRTQAWIDLFGTICLLMPMCLLIIISSWDYVTDAWSYHESSREAGGLPGVWLLKTFILIMPCLLLLQGIAMTGRNSLFLLGLIAHRHTKT